MICFRDMTFCEGGNPLCAKFKNCPRALDYHVKESARRWWQGEKGEAPIARFEEPEKLNCYETEARQVQDV